MERNLTIIRLYLRLLEKRYKHVNSDEILEYAGISRTDLLASNPISGDKLYRFFKCAIDATKNNYLAREAGRYYMSVDVLGISKNYMLSMMAPRFIFKRLNCLLSGISHPFTYTTKWLNGNTVILTVTPLDKKKENQFHCSQRKGVIEAIVETFSGSPAKIQTKSCSCKGDRSCEYVITWQESNQLKWKRRWMAGLVTAPVVNILTAILYPHFVLHYLLPTSAIFLLILSLLVERIGKVHLQESMAAITDICDREKESAEINEQNSLMIEEIGQAISVPSDVTPDSVTQSICKIMSERLYFDRGLIMLRRDSYSKQFVHACSYHIADELKREVSSFYFNLDNDEEKNGIFQQVVEKKEPYWLGGIPRKNEIIVKSDRFLSALEARTCVCCPIINDEVCLGLIYVDLQYTDRIITTSDVNLVRGIASFLGVALSSANTMEILNNQIEEITARDILLSQQKKRLREEIELQTASLKKAVFQANTATSAKSQFLANMSHEIRTPLYGIIGYAESLATDIVDPKKQKKAQTIHESAESLLQIINAVLDVSKIEAGMMKLAATPFELRKTLSLAVDVFKVAAAKKNIDLTYEIDTEIPNSLLGDSSKLLQVLSNLIGNAIKFTHEGTVCLTVKNKKSNSKEITLLFSVKDTGIGMTPAEVNKVFSSFSQGSARIAQQYGGTGLGLTISKHLVEKMGGELAVKTKKGQGSEFYFEGHFKVADTVIKCAKPQCPCINLSNDKHVLIIDDSETNRNVTSEHLSRGGYLIDTAGSGQEGIEKIAENDYDMILMDIQMPDMDGYETTRNLRQLGFTVLPIIAMTASSSVATLDKCIDSGMNHVITKPISRADLLNEAYLWTSEKISYFPPKNESPVLDLEHIRTEFDNNLDCVHRTIEGFLTEAGQNITKIKHSLPCKELDKVARISHAIKGGSGLLYAQALNNACAKLEQAALSEDLSLVKKLSQEVQVEYNNLLVYVSSISWDEIVWN